MSDAETTKTDPRLAAIDALMENIKVTGTGFNSIAITRAELLFGLARERATIAEEIQAAANPTTGTERERTIGGLLKPRKEHPSIGFFAGSMRALMREFMEPLVSGSPKTAELYAALLESGAMDRAFEPAATLATDPAKRRQTSRTP